MKEGGKGLTSEFSLSVFRFLCIGCRTGGSEFRVIHSELRVQNLGFYIRLRGSGFMV